VWGDSASALAQPLLFLAAVNEANLDESSSAQDVFAVSRTLLLGRLLWGESAALTLDALAPVVGVPAERVELAVDLLCRAGIAEVDSAQARVALTREGLRELAGT